MAKDSPLIVRKSLFSWIISKNTRLQIALVVTAILAALANVLPLEMQKRIVNDAINLQRFDLLIFYCGIYLAAVITVSMLKYLINILQNIIGQRTLSDMRKALYAHILTIPLRKIRIIWNLYRFGVKTVNSLFTNFSRFLVFALGGYLAINGRLELGGLWWLFYRPRKSFTIPGTS